MSQAPSPPLRILHCFSSFAADDKAPRAAVLMNAFGAEAEHTIVSADPEAVTGRAHIATGVKVRFLRDFPALAGRPTPGRLVGLAQAMKPYDLICTYDWGAIDATMAHGVFAANLGLPPLIHHEDRLDAVESERLKPTRNWYRRAALRDANKLVVPSRFMEKIALHAWQQPPARIARIAPGIDTGAFSSPPDPNALRVIKRPGERWVGTLAALTPEQQLPLLVEAMQALTEEWHLVIAGEGPERETIRARAAELELSHRVHLAGAIAEPQRIIGLFDIFALSSRGEHSPLAVAEAMAAGLPVAAPDVGDIRAMVAEPNRPYIALPGDAAALGQMLADLAGNESLRGMIGAANRARACAEYSAEQMIARYREVYWQAARRPS